MDDTVEQVTKAATKFYDDLKCDENGRYRSWEYCYYNFYKARKESEPDIDYLSLQLAFYLASWGMYRGSSFLLQKDYKVHTPVVVEILKKKYDVLFGANCEDLCQEENLKLLEELNDFLILYYEKIRHSVKGDLKTGLSETLITKILMGTLGCVPAYDRYFIAGIKASKVAVGSYKIKSVRQLAEFYNSNFEKLESAREHLLVEGMKYPQMKLLDMGFWQIGADME